MACLSSLSTGRQQRRKGAVNGLEVSSREDILGSVLWFHLLSVQVLSFTEAGITYTFKKIEQKYFSLFSERILVYYEK